MGEAAIAQEEVVTAPPGEKAEKPPRKPRGEEEYRTKYRTARDRLFITSLNYTRASGDSNQVFLHVRIQRTH